MFTPPYTPMDLALHIEHAVKHHFLMANGTHLQVLPDSNTRAMIDGIADGVANWMLQRDQSAWTRLTTEQLSQLPSELLERVSVMIAEAAIEAQKAGR